MQLKMLLFVLLLLFSIGFIQSKARNAHDIDKMYSDLFRLSPNGALDLGFDQNLKFSIEFILFYIDIERLFNLVDHSLLNEKKRELMEEKRKMFVNFMSSGQQKHSFVRNCEAWKFWHEVSSTFVKRSLFNENTKEEMQKRKIVDIKKINCEKMEKALSQMGEAKQKNAETDLAEFYLLDLELGHFNAIRFLLGLKGNGEKWKFSEFFDVYQLPKESNFAFQLRILHINNAKVKLTQIKKEMKQLLDGKHWTILEFEALTYLAPELLDEQSLAMKYLPIISMGHNEIFTVVEAGVRIYFGRIWKIFLAFKRQEKDSVQRSDWAAISKKLENKLKIFFGEQVKKHSLSFSHKIWLDLAKMYNETFALNENEKMAIKNFDFSNLELIEQEIVEDHCQNMEQLIGGKNEFSEVIKGASNLAKFRVKQFITARLNRENLDEENELMAKFPALGQMLQFDDLSFSIIDQYQRVLMLETALSGADLDTFNTNVLYYIFRQMLIEKVDARQLVKLGAQNAQLGRKVAELMRANADGRLEGEAEKRKQICHLERFMKWFMKNNEKQDESGSKLNSDINSMLGSDDALKNGPKIESVDDIWQASNCEDEKVANEAVQRLSKCPIIEQIHIRQLTVFYYKHEFFSNFLHANAYNFPIIKNSGLNLSENASDFYYEMIFSPYNDDNQMYAEIMLALRYAMIRIYGLKDQIKGSHSEDLERETIRILIVLRIIELFDDRMPNVRMLCVAMSFLKMIIDKRKTKRLSWDPSAVVAQCLETEAEPIFAEQRFYMVPYHQEYFKQFLALCKRDDALTTIIREGLCKLSLLSRLIGDDSLFRLFNFTLIREKLIDRNFFNNKKFLLSQNYLGLLIGRTDEERQTNRVLADLIVLTTNYFEVDKFGHSEAIRKIVDLQWLHCRFLYESVVENVEESRKISFFVGIFIPELIKFLEANKMLANNSKKFTNALQVTEREAVAEMDTQWFNSKNEYAKPSEIVQKMHFDQLMMLRNDENFTEIYKEIQNNKIAQSNLLLILTKEDMKKFIDEIGGKYEKNESEKEKENGEKIKSEKKKSKKKGKKKNKKGKAETEAKEKTQQNEAKFEEKKEAENAEEEKENENRENGKKKNDENANENDENANETREFLTGEIVPQKNDHGKVLAPTESYSNKLSELCNNSFLWQEYKNLILNAFDEEYMNMLTLGGFINEIEDRFKMVENISKMENLSDFMCKEKAQNLLEKWEEFKNEMDQFKKVNKKEFGNLEEKLYEKLRNLLLFIDGEGQLSGLNVKNNFAKANLKVQIHLKNILWALISDKKMGKNWQKFDNETKKMKLFKLLQTQMEQFKIEQSMEKMEKMMEQNEIDNELFEKSAIKEDEQQKYLLTIFPLHSQQITIVNRDYLVKKFNENFDNYLTNVLYQNIYYKKKFERKREAALGQINAIVDNWSNKHARLLISGSLLLDVHTIGSDVNLFCVAPGERLKLSDFMGSDKNGKCMENKCKSEEADDAKSLFCQICEDKSTANLIKIESASILLIRFAFDGIEFDISFVAVPKVKTLAHKMDDNELKSLLEHFDWSVNEQKHMLRSLSSFRATLYIFNLFYKEAQQNVNELNESRKTFQNLLITLKIWAKNNYIYSNKIGFLNGIALAIMVAKIMLIYPNSTLPFLLDKFFLFYFSRYPQIPIQLSKGNDISPNANLFLSDARELEMPVLTPTSLVQNAARLVTHSNAKVIRRQMFDALNQISSMKNKQFELDALLKNSIPFSQKFGNFIVINCVAEDKEEADAFCDFVEWRMRLQIIFDIDKKGGGGIETHLYPNVYQENCILTQKLVKFSFRANHCKIWLLGIYGKNAISERITAMAQSFDTTIKRHYFLKKVENGNIRKIDDFFNTTKIELKSIMAKKEELI